MRCRVSRARLLCLGLFASGAWPAAATPRLFYALSALGETDASEAAAPAQASTAEAIDPAAAERQGMRSGSYLTLDLGVVYDSNFTNQTGLHAIDVVFDGETVPIELDPAYRSRGGVGQSVGATGGVRIPVAENIAAAVDADVQWANYPGGIGDDLTLLLAAGPELTDGQKQGAVQLFAFERIYGGVRKLMKKVVGLIVATAFIPAMALAAPSPGAWGPGASQHQGFPGASGPGANNPSKNPASHPFPPGQHPGGGNSGPGNSAKGPGGSDHKFGPGQHPSPGPGPFNPGQHPGNAPR